MATFQDRLKTVIGPRGYETSMRRSLQSVVLYEAKRCIAPRLASLRPFQRKVAFVDQAHALVESLDFLLEHHKHEILWRTATSKEHLTQDLGWKRLKLIEKELSIVLATKAKEFCARGRSHEEVCDMIVQSLFESVTGNKDKPHPLHWEYAHNHCMMAFRLYYRGDHLDPSFPEAIAPREIIVPAEKPRANVDTTPYYIQVNGKKSGGSSSTPLRSGPPVASLGGILQHADDDDEPPLDVAALIGETNPTEDRRKILKEVREHLDILKEFEGIISDEDLAKRKRELFLALPSAPPSLGSPSKRSRS